MDEIRLLRRQQVVDLTGLSVSTLYAKIRNNEFPKPLKTSANTVAWRFSDVANWVRSLQVADR